MTMFHQDGKKLWKHLVNLFKVDFAEIPHHLIEFQLYSLGPAQELLLNVQIYLKFKLQLPVPLQHGEEQLST